METQYKPLKIGRFPEFGIGVEILCGSRNMEATEGSNGGDRSPPIRLGLELGLGSDTGRTNSCMKSWGFTISQMQELQLQFLIYKYMEGGIPVPHHLVLPIWKSVAGSVSAHTSGLYPLSPNFFGIGASHWSYKNEPDPEPGRCRRTDGKKWRCSKEAAPHHKYCEKHMHRGRHRSRKLVEASQPSTTTTTTAGASTITNPSFSFPISSECFGFSPNNVLPQKTEPSL